MADNTTTSGAAVAPVKPATGLQKFNSTITNPKTQEYLGQVLGAKKQSFVNNLTALVANNANLQECEPVTLMYAAIKATALDLPLDANLGCAYVIPYKNNRLRKTEAQFQIGYKGFIQLAIRSGQFACLNATDVREGEMQGTDLLSGEVRLQSLPNRHELPVVGYAAYFRLTNGFAKTLYMTKGEVEAHALRYSQTYSSRNAYTKSASKWTTDFDSMAKKTVIKLLLSRYAPLSVEMRLAVDADQAVYREPDRPIYVDNEPGKTLAEIAAENAGVVEHDDTPDVVEVVNEDTGEVTETPAEQETATEGTTTEEGKEAHDGKLF